MEHQPDPAQPVPEDVGGNWEHYRRAEGTGADCEAGSVGKGIEVAWRQLLGSGKVFRRSGRRLYSTSSCPSTAGTEAA